MTGAPHDFIGQCVGTIKVGQYLHVAWLPDGLDPTWLNLHWLSYPEGLYCNEDDWGPGTFVENMDVSLDVKEARS